MLLIAFFAIGFTASDEDDPILPDDNTEKPEDNQNEEGAVKVSGFISLPNSVNTDHLQNCTVVSMSGTAKIIDNMFEISSNANENVQTYIVIDAEEKVYMAARSIYKKGEKVTIDIQSTALAIATLHPLFAPLKGEDYNKVVEIIKSSSQYQPFYEVVENLILEKKNLYDLSNETLLIAFSNLTEDVCSKVDNNDYADSNISLARSTGTITRAIYENPKIYPLYAEINGNKLILRNTGLTPSYYGTVQTADGQTVNYAVPSRSDYGGMDIFKSVGEINLGPECPFTFSTEGEYHFNLSRTNAAATLDFYMRIAGSVLSVMGLNVTDENAIVEISRCISNAITTAGSSVSDAQMDFMDWFGIAYGATVDYLSRETSHLAQKGLWSQVRVYGRILGGAWNWYNKIKGAANATARITFALNSPEELDFCLCYYSGQISTCTEASLTIASGNEQTGYSKQKLLLPLKVYVQTLGDDGLYYPSSSYHRIKYEVISGGGLVDNEYVSADNNNVAQTYWTLGEEGDQKIKVTVVDIITDKEISEPVYFTAELRENADLTVRLDWHKLSGSTDIDLHVTDPYGEEIAWYHMNSASGGWLDRDDVVGPGPEHISWSKAPSGAYLVQVHYYGSL